MGLKSLDEQTLEIWSRQFGHLPEPGWRPQDNLTPLEAWEGLLLDDDSPLPTRIMAEIFYRCGACARATPLIGPPCLAPLCELFAMVRRFVTFAGGRVVFFFCGAAIPKVLRTHRRVVAVMLPQKGLVGALPPHPGRGLRHINRLVLFENALHGPLPSNLGQYTRLEALNLSSNRLVGKLPVAFKHLKRLRILDLHGNALTGSLSEQCTRAKFRHLRALTHISLAENAFTGKFPDEFSKMSWLVELHLSGLRLNGHLPDCQKLKHLSVLDLSFNEFTGPLPDFGTLAPPQGSNWLTRRRSSTSSRVTPQPSISSLSPSSSSLAAGTSAAPASPPASKRLTSFTTAGAATSLFAKKKEASQEVISEQARRKNTKGQRAEREANIEGADEERAVRVVAAAEDQSKTVILDTTNQSSLTVVTHVPKPQFDMAHPRPKPAHTLSGHDLEKQRLDKATPKELEAAAAIARFASVAEESDSSVSSTMSTPRNDDVNKRGIKGSGGGGDVSPLSSSPNLRMQNGSGDNNRRLSTSDAPSSLSGSFMKGGSGSETGKNKGLRSGQNRTGATGGGAIVRQPTRDDGSHLQGKSGVSFSGVSFAADNSYAPTSSSTGGAPGKPGLLTRFMAKKPGTAGSEGGETSRAGTATADGGRSGTASSSRRGRRTKEPVVPCISLRTLRLTRNRLTGPVPKGFEKLTNMVRLDLGTNRLTSIADVDWYYVSKTDTVFAVLFQSDFSPALFTIETNNYLELSSRNLESQLKHMHHFDASQNKIEGPVPLGLVSLISLNTLRLEHNHLTGVVPDVVSRLQSLSLIDFEHNPGLLLRPATLAWMRTNLKHRTVAKI